MKTKHTPEPWKVHSVQYMSYISASNETMIAGSSRLTTLSENYHNMHRIVACVNAMAGIDDPAAFVEAAKKAMAKECECFPKK